MKSITFFCGSLKVGGPQRVIVTIANQLVLRNINVNIITTLDNVCAYNVSSKVNVKKCPEFSQNRIFRLIYKFFWIRRMAKSDRSDVIISFYHTINMYLMVHKILGLDKKIIISERNDPNNEPKQKWLRFLRNYLYRFADFIVFQTADAQAYYSEKIQRKSAIIQNPMRTDLPDKYNGVRKPIIVNFCRLTHQKNLFLLIDAFKKIVVDYPEYKLHIYGNGVEEKRIASYIKENNMSTYIKMFNGRPDVHEIIYNHAMYVSSSDFEGISNSMMEALAIGLPTICTDCPIGGARSLIKNKINGLLVPVQNIDKLYEAIKYMIENPDQAEKMGREATKLIDTLSPKAIANKWYQIMTKVVENSQE